jgi:threonine/homoserine/homoserine lactone efflux protein
VSPNVWAFTAVTVPFVATPGASTALVLRNSVAGGVRSGVATAVGVNAASIGYGLLAAFGVALALQRWPVVWVALRIGGTGYLAWLGLRSLWHAATAPRSAMSAPADRASAHWTRSISEGFLTNALNPSIATFYLLVLPKFIPPGGPLVASALLLTSIHVGIAISWHLTWAAAGGTLSRALERPGAHRALESITGIALLILAIKLL